MKAARSGRGAGMSEPRNEIVDDQLGEAAPGVERQVAAAAEHEEIPVSPTPQPPETVDPER
jgi:hypothetical protein